MKELVADSRQINESINESSSIALRVQLAGRHLGTRLSGSSIDMMSAALQISITKAQSGLEHVLVRRLESDDDAFIH